jgi:alpha-1,2-mannosyltransferase
MSQFYLKDLMLKNRSQLKHFTKVKSIVSEYGIERITVSTIVNCILGLALVAGLKSLGTSLSISIFLSVMTAFIGIVLLTKHLPTELIGFRKLKPWLSYSWFLIAFVCFLQIARLSIFMIDPSQTQYSLFPGDKWMVEHCCLTAYSESAKFVFEGEKNIYKKELYTGAESLINKNKKPKLDGFNIDLYHYPPPFLLLPIFARFIVGGDFLDLRMLWFAISVLSLMTAIGFIIYRLEPEGRMRMIGMAPFILCSLPVLVGLQMSNVQIIVIAISIIAMALFNISKPMGGLLLAMSSVAKIFPGILFVYLIANKKFREAGWVVGFALILCVLAFIVVGPNPFQAFIGYELPKLSSGEAFSGPFSRAFAVAANMAPFGVPLKLGQLGVPGMTLEVGRIVSSIHLLMVLILVIWSGRQKPRSNTEMISVWISLICLGSLASPFAPANYILVSLIILICLNGEFLRLWMVISMLLLIGIPFLVSQEAPFFIQALAFLPSQIFAIAIPAFILYRAGLRTTEKEIEILTSSVVPDTIKE